MSPVSRKRTVGKASECRLFAFVSARLFGRLLAHPAIRHVKIKVPIAGDFNSSRTDFDSGVMGTMIIPYFYAARRSVVRYLRVAGIFLSSLVRTVFVSPLSLKIRLG